MVSLFFVFFCFFVVHPENKFPTQSHENVSNKSVGLQ